jgi:hypothetical protein
MQIMKLAEPLPLITGEQADDALAGLSAPRLA